MTLTCLVKEIHEIFIKIGVFNIHRGLHQELQQIHPLPLRRRGPTSPHTIVLRGRQETIVYLVIQGVALQ